MLLAYAAVLLTASAVHGCAPNSKGGTCYSGLLFDNQPPQELAQFESCKEDLKRDWCTVVYNQDSAEAEFHCYNHYNTNPLLGYPVCGDETHVEVNSGGCKRVKELKVVPFVERATLGASSGRSILPRLLLSWR
ncbi:hypothetical protein QR680_012047 [Steinernema hermaphroditum]|uniref:Uncharacterized protein n=1 Tax=Steinernema hermaphroditum TaxID=289476 RepID=A0AA39I0Q6_9BILA|nr:hypothetical protein QR680_012047 [Steinernema hermaphroditum]